MLQRGRPLHRDEPDGPEVLGPKVGPRFSAADEHLRPVRGSDGRHENAALGELRNQLARNLGGRGRHDDPIERSLLGPTPEAIPHAHLDVGIAELRETIAR